MGWPESSASLDQPSAKETAALPILVITLAAGSAKSGSPSKGKRKGTAGGPIFDNT
jgi:hypothetical protein